MKKKNYKQKHYVVPDDLHSARRLIDDADILSTLERCYRLIHEPVKLAKAPSNTQRVLPNSVPGSASSLRTSVKIYLARFLKRSVFDKIKMRQTRLDHNLFDVIWPAMKKSDKKSTNERFRENYWDAGIVAPDFDVFVVFQEFLVPIIKDIHCIDIHSDFQPHPQMQYFPMRHASYDDLMEKSGVELEVDPPLEMLNLNLDKSGKYIVEGVVECSRNVDHFELPLNLNVGQLEQVERIIIGKLLSMEFSKMIEEKEIGTYYTMNEVLENPSEIRVVLATKGLLIPLLNNADPYQSTESMAVNGQYWPYGRGVYLSHDHDIVAWVNCQEHLRVLCCTDGQSPGNIGRAYTKLGKAMTHLEKKIEFRNSYFLGYLSARPSFLGTSLHLTLTLELAHLIKERENLLHLCNVRGLHMASHPNLNCIRVSNMQAMGITEWKIFHDFCTAVANVIQLEKDLTIESTKHIAAMLVNIFRKKKNSLGETATN